MMYFLALFGLLAGLYGIEAEEASRHATGGKYG